ncbi:MAG: hypothetical protein ACC650_03385 [Gammaproteobacteria bacterium]
MSKKGSTANVEVVERRRHWLDRRTGNDRRNSGRLNLTNYDCRSGLPRREADVGGDLADGDVWWNKGITQYE